jgi:hypothetical protein
MIGRRTHFQPQTIYREHQVHTINWALQQCQSQVRKQMLGGVSNPLLRPQHQLVLALEPHLVRRGRTDINSIYGRMRTLLVLTLQSILIALHVMEIAKLMLCTALELSSLRLLRQQINQQLHPQQKFWLLKRSSFHS